MSYNGMININFIAGADLRWWVFILSSFSFSLLFFVCFPCAFSLSFSSCARLDGAGTAVWLESVVKSFAVHRANIKIIMVYTEWERENQRWWRRRESFRSPRLPRRNSMNIHSHLMCVLLVYFLLLLLRSLCLISRIISSNTITTWTWCFSIHFDSEPARDRSGRATSRPDHRRRRLSSFFRLFERRLSTARAASITISPLHSHPPDRRWGLNA